MTTKHIVQRWEHRSAISAVDDFHTCSLTIKPYLSPQIGAQSYFTYLNRISVAKWCYLGGDCSLELLVEARLGFTSVFIISF